MIDHSNHHGTAKPILSLATSSKRTEVPSSCTKSSKRASCHSPSRKVCNIPPGTMPTGNAAVLSWVFFLGPLQTLASWFMTIGVPCANCFPCCPGVSGWDWEILGAVESWKEQAWVAICCNAGRSSSCTNSGSWAHTIMRLLLATHAISIYLSSIYLAVYPNLAVWCWLCSSQPRMR